MRARRATHLLLSHTLKKANLCFVYRAGLNVPGKGPRLYVHYMITEPIAHRMQASGRDGVCTDPQLPSFPDSPHLPLYSLFLNSRIPTRTILAIDRREM